MLLIGLYLLYFVLGVCTGLGHVIAKAWNTGISYSEFFLTILVCLIAWPVWWGVMYYKDRTGKVK